MLLIVLIQIFLNNYYNYINRIIFIADTGRAVYGGVEN